ncbi:hypothetical protein BHE74_00018565 [Ensete ventricosum]|nr:hypothetical protein GW17_00035989 [Ensete ventricosum]RWW73546.1 hypothetical protein BHE74_00018565 [Ensete ventricosum]
MPGDSLLAPEVCAGLLGRRLVDREINQSPHAGVEIWSLTKLQPLEVYCGVLGGVDYPQSRDLVWLASKGEVSFFGSVSFYSLVGYPIVNAYTKAEVEGQEVHTVSRKKANAKFPLEANLFSILLFLLDAQESDGTEAVMFDESKWVLADANFAVSAIGIDADWVITDGDEGAVSGVFFHTVASTLRRSRPCYAPFGRLPTDLADPSLAFLPTAASARSSSRGLLLLVGPWSTHYVCNPATAKCCTIPRPPRPHLYCHTPALALVNLPDDHARFYVVCADMDPSAGGYRFQIFSSPSGTWQEGSAVTASADPIVPCSGVSAAGVAYWRTAAPAVLAYDPEADKARVLPPPPGCVDAGGTWELGEAGEDGRLCCTCVTEPAVVVYRLGPSDEWSILDSLPVTVVGGDEAVEQESGVPIACRARPPAVKVREHEA